MKNYNLYYRGHEFAKLAEENGFPSGGARRFDDIRRHFKTKYNAQIAECDRDGKHYYVLKFNTEKWYSWFLLKKSNIL